MIDKKFSGRNAILIKFESNTFNKNNVIKNVISNKMHYISMSKENFALVLFHEFLLNDKI